MFTKLVSNLVIEPEISQVFCSPLDCGLEFEGVEFSKSDSVDPHGWLIPDGSDSPCEWLIRMKVSDSTDVDRVHQTGYELMNAGAYFLQSSCRELNGNYGIVCTVWNVYKAVSY